MDQLTRTEISTGWLNSLGFERRDPTRHGWSRDYGDGFLLQLVPDSGGWILELWNGFKEVRSRASFPRILVYQEELLPVLHLMEFVPF